MIKETNHGFIRLTKSYPLDHELLEAKATVEACSCFAYVLADNLDIATDQELIDIINHTMNVRCVV